MKDTFKNILKIKSIVTLVMVALFCYMAITARVTGDQVLNIVSIIITFYFAKKAGEE